MRNLALVTVCLLLASCGGGGGGSGGGALVQTPTPTYTQYVDFVNNGGTVPSVQGQIFRSRGKNYNSPYEAASIDFANFSSISLMYSLPDSNGNQTITMTGTVNWDGNPFSGSETISGILDSSDGAKYRFTEDKFYNKLWAFSSQDTDNSSDDADSYFGTMSVAFADFDDTPRTVEKTKYVTQFLQYRQQYSNNVGFYGTNYSFNYDLVAFVMGSYTQSNDMPVSGSATYNGFTQMWEIYETHGPNSSNSAALASKYYLNGDASFSADFSSRAFTGVLDFKYESYADSPYIQYALTNEFKLNLDGTISGTTFSGTVNNPNLSDPTDDITSSFSGNFFGPNASELGGTFNYSNVNFTRNDGTTGSGYRIGTFTACQSC